MKEYINCYDGACVSSAYTMLHLAHRCDMALGYIKKRKYIKKRQMLINYTNQDEMSIQRRSRYTYSLYAISEEETCLYHLAYDNSKNIVNGLKTYKK